MSSAAAWFHSGDPQTMVDLVLGLCGAALPHPASEASAPIEIMTTALNFWILRRIISSNLMESPILVPKEYRATRSHSVAWIIHEKHGVRLFLINFERERRRH